MRQQIVVRAGVARSGFEKGRRGHAEVLAGAGADQRASGRAVEVDVEHRFPIMAHRAQELAFRHSLLLLLLE